MFLVDDRFRVDSDCGIADVTCKVQVTVAEWLGDLILWLADGLVTAPGFTAGGGLWETSVSQAGVWLSVAIMVMFVTSVIGLAVALIRLRRDLIIRALLGMVLSIPAVFAAYFVVGLALPVVDEVSDGILARFDGPDGLSGAIYALLAGGLGVDPTAGIVVNALTGNTVSMVQMLLVLVLFFFGVLLVAVAMAFRNFVLMLLIAFAPLAFVLLPAGGGGVWVRRWVSAVTAMALAKPLILGTLLLAVTGLNRAGTPWSAGGFASMIGLFVAGCMPIVAYSFFQFLGGDGGGGDQVGSRAAGQASGQVRGGVSRLVQVLRPVKVGAAAAGGGLAASGVAGVKKLSGGVSGVASGVASGAGGGVAGAGGAGVKDAGAGGAAAAAGAGGGSEGVRGASDGGRSGGRPTGRSAPTAGRPGGGVGSGATFPK